MRFPRRDLVVALLLGLTSGAAGATETADYDVTFVATWSAATHPVSFPFGPHFSPLIGGTHSGNVSFWAPAGMATHGMEQMAETGASSPLADEISVAIGAGTADGLIIGGDIPVSPGSVVTSFTIDSDFPLVTLVSMIAPSPDWFVGVHDLALREGGQWVSEKVVTLFPYDSGTDSGVTYVTPDQDTNPADPIALITTLPVGNGVPLGTFTFTRTDTPAVPAASSLAGWLLVAALVIAGSGFLLRRGQAPSTTIPRAG